MKTVGKNIHQAGLYKIYNREKKSGDMVFILKLLSAELWYIYLLIIFI